MYNKLFQRNAEIEKYYFNASVGTGPANPQKRTAAQRAAEEEAGLHQTINENGQRASKIMALQQHGANPYELDLE
jgi:hypothetical protein